MVVVPYRNDEREFIVWGCTRDGMLFLEVHGHRPCFPPLTESSTGNCCRLDVVALRDNREPGLRYLLAITNRCRIVVCLRPICVVSGKCYIYETAT